MTKRMLIDAAHNEETRVAIVENKRLENYDYENKSRRPLKGNIYLAKVTRIEPSLQAAFVDYGGNRHGFLPFSEIHPDYFRIPIADREALKKEFEDMMDEFSKKEEENDQEENEKDEENQNAESSEENDDEADETSDNDTDEIASDDSSNDDHNDENEDKEQKSDRKRNGRKRKRKAHNQKREERFAEDQEALERRFRFSLRRRYKIQEVVKRGQIMLVQVSREERGNKGAAVSSYLSLPGRYCVLMPNSPRSGGISRKIASYKDRVRMRDVMKELSVPDGMSVILRTAGLSRNKTEIKRDLDYLIRLWNTIRETTLESIAPNLVHEEASLIRRVVRDLYVREIDEIVVEGDEGYRNAKDFMKILIPSHAKKVKHYKEEKSPIFIKYGIESQINKISDPSAQLPSGGYLVINQTEALVAIDVNSGRATKERHIEETALKTNLEAAVEIAKQLVLRDLGGLVVVDFIDMEDRRNNSKVERKMRDALSNDRARVQMGRISSFGLMELSRQRLNPSLAETQFETCQHCQGTGRLRNKNAVSILVLRGIEETAVKHRKSNINVIVNTAAALQLLNTKRKNLFEIEQRYDTTIDIQVDDTLGHDEFKISHNQKNDAHNQSTDEESEKNSNKTQNASSNTNDKDSDGKERKGRRRGRRGGRKRNRRDTHDNQSDQKSDNQQDKDTNSKNESANVKKDASESNTDKESKDTKPSQKKTTSKRKPAAQTKQEKKDTPSKENEKPSEKTSKTDDKEEKPEEKKTRKPRTTKKKSTQKSISASNDSSGDKKTSGKTKSSSSSSENKKPNEYETVNQPPDSKKKGWWNKIVS